MFLAYFDQIYHMSKINLRIIPPLHSVHYSFLHGMSSLPISIVGSHRLLIRGVLSLREPSERSISTGSLCYPPRRLAMDPDLPN